VRLIGGVAFRDPTRPWPAPALRAMAGRVRGTNEIREAWTRGAGLLSAVGAEALDASAGVSAVADLELTNLSELKASVAGAPPVAGLVTALYRRQGPGFVRELRGAFALAVWDAPEDRLFLAVDRFGVKRLHYVETRDGIAFASRPSALLALPRVPCEVDATAVFDYLNFGFVPSSASIFAGIRRLAPGHTLLFERGATAVRRYWDLGYPECGIGVRDAAAATYRHVEEAVRGAFEGATAKETGAFLSGGTDSSTIVGLMSRLTGERVSVFSIDFGEPRYSELRYAELAARHFGATHYTHTLTADEALGLVPELVEAYDEPLGNDSTVATYRCAKLARECGMSRLLGGDGGDELFGGNERYRTDRIFAAYGRLPRPLRRAALEPVLRRLPDGGASLLGRAQRYVRRANLPNPRRFYSYELFFAQEGAALLAPDFVRAVDTEAPWRTIETHFDAAAARSELNRLMYVDLKLTIGDSDLYKVTRTAEVAGIEVRFPMLDHRLAEFTGTLPARYKVRGLEKRYLFKRAFRELLPAATLAKPKHGFGVPVSEWLRTDRGFRELARDTVLAPDARVTRYLGRDGLDRLVGLHAADATSYYGSFLWRLLMLELWHRRHAEGAV
jgi:asparagine synthase (glutamine-hydrolysing)